MKLSKPGAFVEGRVRGNPSISLSFLSPHGE